jgi:hypothetical protein
LVDVDEGGGLDVEMDEFDDEAFNDLEDPNDLLR